MKRTISISVFLLACNDVHLDEIAATTDGGDKLLICGDTTCDPTRGSVCTDADTLRTYTTTCDDGVCGYVPTDVECGQLGCCGDHCCGVSPVFTRGEAR
jgi:hypothetical protein